MPVETVSSYGPAAATLHPVNHNSARSRIAGLLRQCGNTPSEPGARPAEQVYIKPFWQCAVRYEPENDGLYPLRWRGESQPITCIYCIGDGSHQTIVRIKALDKFIDNDLNALQRAQLYHENLTTGIFTEQDLSEVPARRAFEIALIGQSKVCARRQIKEGECLGILGGNIVPDYKNTLKYHPLKKQLEPYAVASHLDCDTSIITDGILAQANTIIERDGVTCNRADSGYNAEPMRFLAVTGKQDSERNPILLTALYATKDIAPGEELRWNFDHRHNDILNVYKALQ